MRAAVYLKMDRVSASIKAPSAGTLRRAAAGVLIGSLMTVAALVAARVQAHAAVSPNAIQLENSLPGDPTWNVFNPPVADGTLSGYGSTISVNRGDSIDFFVTTTAPRFSIDIYRSGWYGGTGARLVTSLGSFAGIQQPIPAPDAVTGMIACRWPKAVTLNVPTSWTTGVYLARLNGSDGNKSFIFFVVRNDGGNEALVFQSSVATYEAYNLWGGTSLYDNRTGGAVYPYAHATKVSFDRPFEPLDSQGAGDYLKWEYPFVRWMESQGYDVTYTTDVDADSNANPLVNHKGFLSVGHDEYWSKGMRENLQTAINAGVSAAFFAADEIFWQIRFEPNVAGQAGRVEVDYKEFATRMSAPGPDPMYGVNDAVVTTLWQLPPVNLPENAVSGLLFEGAGIGDYVVQNASSWVYAGSGFSDGSVVPGLVGYEYDGVSNIGTTPAGLNILSVSPMGGNTFANSSIYQAVSGAWVFAAGTVQWSSGLDSSGYGCGRVCLTVGIQRTTANILNAFLVGRPVHDLRITAPTSATAGQPLTITVTAEDAKGYPVPWYDGTVHFATSDATPGVALPADSTLTDGKGSFSVTLIRAGLQTVTVSDAATPTISGTLTVDVHAAKAATLGLTGIPACVKANQTFSVGVTLYDRFGNVADGYRGTVHFSSTDLLAKLPPDYQFAGTDAGSYAFAVTLRTPTTPLTRQTVTVGDIADPSLAATSPPIAVSLL